MKLRKKQLFVIAYRLGVMNYMIEVSAEITLELSNVLSFMLTSDNVHPSLLGHSDFGIHSLFVKCVLRILFTEEAIQTESYLKQQQLQKQRSQ